MTKAVLGEILIDPQKFTDAQWVEIFNACELIPPAESKQCQEDRRNAESFTATVDDIESAILACRNKAERVRNGELGPSDEGEGVDIEEWADDLEQAAEVLNGLLPTPGPPALPRIGMSCDAYAAGREELATLLDRASQLADEMNLWVGGSPAQKAFEQIAAQLRELIAKENS